MFTDGGLFDDLYQPMSKSKFKKKHLQQNTASLGEINLTNLRKKNRIWNENRYSMAVPN